MPLSRLISLLPSRSEQTLLLDDEAGSSVIVDDGSTHLVPINNPLPTAKHIPTILKVELLFVLTSPAAELEAAAAEAVELATVLDMARRRSRWDWWAYQRRLRVSRALGRKIARAEEVGSIGGPKTVVRKQDYSDEGWWSS
jgi:hypothetical protein